jgi:hypothetical protein
MKFDLDLLRRAAPFALPAVILAVGWMVLIGPTAAENARVAGEVDLLGQRLTQVQASLARPAPPLVSGDPGATFASRVAARDASSQVLEQLARLASGAPALNLLIETGDRVALAGAGPRATDDTATDPRLVLFDLPLAYSPISMSFDAEYSRAGELLWRLRDLATTVEIRSVQVTPRVGDGPVGAAARDGLVHVSLVLFAYAQQVPVAAAAGTMP